MKSILKALLYVVLISVIIFVLFLLKSTFGDYKPREQSILLQNESSDILSSSTAYKLIIWNIGYCGLDASMDFFYDGGKQVRPSKQKVEENLDSVISILKNNDSIDFYMLQEVDIDSKRSYYINQNDSIKESLTGYFSTSALNYKVAFVPVPVAKPMGKVKSGLQTLSKYSASLVSRHSYPGNYSWPMGVFMLDRCFMVSRFSVDNTKELVLINTHNSAYDDGSLRAAQMDYLKDFLISEYEEGKYVIVGGDWNQSPAGFNKHIEDWIFDDENYAEIPESYMDTTWTWAFDTKTPTNRRVKKVYNRDETPTTLIDFYLLSPNIKKKSVKTLDLNFNNSDHHPVVLELVLED